MLKELIKSSIAGVFILFFVTACAEEKQQANSPEKQTDQHSQSSGSTDQAQTIMDQPVDFSTPDAIEKSMQKIAEQGGEKSHRAVEVAMQYVSVYNLGVSGDKEKLYKKLDGKTPNQIIAMMKR